MKNVTEMDQRNETNVPFRSLANSVPSNLGSIWNPQPMRAIDTPPNIVTTFPVAMRDDDEGLYPQDERA